MTPRRDPPPPGLTELQRRLAELCRARGASLQGASLAAGLKRDRFWRLIHKGEVPSPATCRAIARYAGWDEDTTLTLAGHRSRSVVYLDNAVEIEAVRDAIIDVILSNPRLPWRARRVIQAAAAQTDHAALVQRLHQARQAL